MWVLNLVSLCTRFLSSVCLQTKRRCSSCLRLIIIRGAQLSAAPLLTLFSQHYWSVLSRPHKQNRHVHIQKHYLVIRKQFLGLITEWLSGESRKNRFQLSWLLSSKVWKGTPYYNVAFVPSASFLSCLEGDNTQPSWYCLALRQMLTELMHCRFHSANWNSSRTFESFVSPSTCLCSTLRPGSPRFVG